MHRDNFSLPQDMGLRIDILCSLWEDAVQILQLARSEVLMQVAEDYSLLACGTMFLIMRNDVLERPAAFIFRVNFDDKGNSKM